MAPKVKRNNSNCSGEEHIQIKSIKTTSQHQTSCASQKYKKRIGDESTRKNNTKQMGSKMEGIIKRNNLTEKYHSRFITQDLKDDLTTKKIQKMILT